MRPAWPGQVNPSGEAEQGFADCYDTRRMPSTVRPKSATASCARPRRKRVANTGDKEVRATIKHASGIPADGSFWAWTIGSERYPSGWRCSRVREDRSDGPLRSSAPPTVLFARRVVRGRGGDPVTGETLSGPVAEGSPEALNRSSRASAGRGQRHPPLGGGRPQRRGHRRCVWCG